MEAVKEITVWAVDYRQPNHVYLLDGSKMIAYIPFGDQQPFYFSKPLPFDRAKRKFETLKVNPFKIQKEETRIRVQGSGGKEYWVDPVAETCSCPGFSFRGNCKHIKAVG